MVIKFKDVVVLDKFEGVSKAGKPYGRLKILVDSSEVFDIFLSSDSLEKCSSLDRKAHVSEMVFDLVPGFDGGLRLIPAWN